jgi:hypothetical protein
MRREHHLVLTTCKDATGALAVDPDDTGRWIGGACRTLGPWRSWWALGALRPLGTCAASRPGRTRRALRTLTAWGARRTRVAARDADRQCCDDGQSFGAHGRPPLRPFRPCAKKEAVPGARWCGRWRRSRQSERQLETRTPLPRASFDFAPSDSAPRRGETGRWAARIPSPSSAPSNAKTDESVG